MGGDTEGHLEPADEVGSRTTWVEGDCASPIVTCFWSLSKLQIVPAPVFI